MVKRTTRKQGPGRTTKIHRGSWCSFALVGKWTKTKDSRGGRWGQACLRTNYTPWNNWSPNFDNPKATQQHEEDHILSKTLLRTLQQRSQSLHFARVWGKNRNCCSVFYFLFLFSLFFCLIFRGALVSVAGFLMYPHSIELGWGFGSLFLAPFLPLCLVCVSLGNCGDVWEPSPEGVSCLVSVFPVFFW